MTSGNANTRRWKLRFEQHAAPFIEPLMGWTGGTDTLSQVELDFPSAEAAIAYARRQGLDFVVQGLAEAPQTRCPMPAKSKPGSRDRMDAQVVRPCTRKFEWVERTLGVGATNNGIDFDLALTNPAAAFDEPERVVWRPQLSAEQKREILRRWALEAYRAADARKRATARTDFSRLGARPDRRCDGHLLQRSRLRLRSRG